MVWVSGTYPIHNLSLFQILPLLLLSIILGRNRGIPFPLCFPVAITNKQHLPLPFSVAPTRLA